MSTDLTRILHLAMIHVSSPYAAILSQYTIFQLQNHGFSIY